MELSVIILAAGQGKRMCSATPKVLHPLGGVPILERIVNTAHTLGPNAIHVVYGNGGSAVRSQLDYLNVNWIEQEAQLGTGHAVAQAIDHIADGDQVLVLAGDVPLISMGTLQALLHQASKASSLGASSLGLVVAEFEDPAGLGRIVRNDKGNVVAIVEHKDADEKQRKIKEINSGILTASAKQLKTYLPQLTNNNTQKEYYLTDIIALVNADGCPIVDVIAHSPEEVFGVNDRQQLAQLERYYQYQAALQLMMQGVTLADPKRFDLRGELDSAKDVVIDINVIIEGKVTIGTKTVIGPNTLLCDSQIGENVTIMGNCVIEGVIIENHCVIGPFARLRPGTRLKAGARVGNFVEIKNSELGEDSKASHLAYIGDATVGSNVNIGAGTITCNYDGANKHRTVIEDNVFIGSDTQLVAPVTVGRNATVGAGSTITQDVPPDQLTVARARQRNIPGWKKPTKQKE